MAKKVTKKFSGGFRDKIKGNIEKQNSQGSSYGYLNLPKGVNMFQIQDPPCKVKFDIMPYIVTDLKHPDRDDSLGNAVPDSIWIRRPFKVHKNVGSEEEAVICLSSFGKKCPICEYRKKLQNEGGDQDEIKALKPSNRSLYVVIPKDNKKFEEKPHIFDFSDYLFQDQLNKDVEEDDQYDYPDLEIGKTLQVTFSAEKFAGRSFAKASRVKFLDREEAYDESILDTIPSLDKCLVELTYDEVHAKFWGEEDELPKKSSKKQVEEDDEDDVPPRKKTAQPSSKKNVPVEVDDDEDVDIDDEDEEDEEDEKPVKKPAQKAPAKPASKSKPAAKKVVEEDDDEDEEEDEEDTPPVRKSKAPSKPSAKKPVVEEDDEDEDELTWEQLSKLTLSKLKTLIDYEDLEIDVDDYDDDINALRTVIAEELDIEIPKKKKK